MMKVNDENSRMSSIETEPEPISGTINLFVQRTSNSHR
jgi:hypothetical protein